MKHRETNLYLYNVFKQQILARLKLLPKDKMMTPLELEFSVLFVFP